MLVREIRIDRDGNWYADGQIMERREIVNLFSTNLWRDETNQYYIKLAHQTFPIVVEDTPYIINEVFEDDGKIKLRLNDERVLDLPEQPIMVINNVPYASLFWERDAKFTRSAFWQLNKYVVETNNSYWLKFNDIQVPMVFQ